MGAVGNHKTRKAELETLFIYPRNLCHSSRSFSSSLLSCPVSLKRKAPLGYGFLFVWPVAQSLPELQGLRGKRVFGIQAALAMSSAVFTPLPISSSLRCSAAAESSSNGVTSGTIFVKLPQQSVAAAQPLSLNSRETMTSSSSASAMSVLHPGMEFVNVMFFKGSYNAQVFVGEDEPADSVVRRFRKAVMQAGVIPECRRRRFHETPQDIVKRKQQNARRRKISSRRFNGPRPEGGFSDKYGDKKETSNTADEDDDFWGYAEEGADANL